MAEIVLDFTKQNSLACDDAKKEALPCWPPYQHSVVFKKRLKWKIY